MWEEYEELKRTGQKLFTLIGDDLNMVSDKHIRTEAGTYRREEDFDEICVALALLAQFLDLDVDSLSLRDWDDTE